MLTAAHPLATVRWRIRWIAVAASIVFGALPAVSHAKQVSVIAQFKPGVSQKAAMRTVHSVGGRHAAGIPVIHGVSARMTPRAARRLERRNGVRAVSLNMRVRGQSKSGEVPDARKLATSFVQSLRLDDVWHHATGQGVGVAVVDTGIAGDLPDFQTSADDPTSRVVASVVTNPDTTTAGDLFGHGTHVAGLIAGNSLWRDRHDAAYGRFAGTAPEAILISIKAGDDHGDATVLDVIYGIEFAIEHKDDYNIRVLNLSLQSTSAESYRTDPLDAAVEAAWFSGITVIAAVGNRGSASDAVNYAPGNDPYVISVGGIDDNGTKNPEDDAIADWSSRGTTQDGFAKPDLYAPGAHILSTLAPDSAFASMCPTCIFAGSYIKAGGSSMAAPKVSGIAADILELHPEWTPDMVKGAIVGTLRTVKKSKKDSADTERPSELDADKAVKAKDERRLALVNPGLTPNDAIVDPATGLVDLVRSRWSRSSWSRSSWSQAGGDAAAPWARSSWSCDCSQTESGAVDPSRSSWSRSSWSSLLGP
jgi:serine protease AprX